jgi:hypothetical protein
MCEECPVCSAQMKEHIDTIDWGGPICEHVATCPNGCYSYEYLYGYTSVHVADSQFGWGYSDDRQAVKAQTDAIDVAIEAVRLARGIPSEDKTGRPQESR